jgi:hypothetical protein
MLPLVGGAQARESSRAVTIPDRLAGYSYLTADVSNAPPGRALALYQHGWGVEFLDFPQAVVLAADEDVYRRLGAAEQSGGPETQGDPGPMQLSPHGLFVAVGDHRTSHPNLAVVDLSTGRVSRHPVESARSVVPLAWSHDEQQVAYVSGVKPTNPYAGPRYVGDLHVLDLRSGTSRPVPGTEQVWAAAFSPDSRQLAVQRSGGLSVVDLVNGTSHTLVGSDVLAGPAAWSPDGSLLARTGPGGLRFVDPRGIDDGADQVRLPLRHPDQEPLLGWTGVREVAVFSYGSEDDTARITSYPLDGDTSRELTRIGGMGNYGVGRMQLASALLVDAGTRAATEADRGPLPAGFRVLLAIGVGVSVMVLTAVAMRMWRRLRRARQRPGPSGPDTRPDTGSPGPAGLLTQRSSSPRRP